MVEIVVRPYQASDRAAILSLVGRFTEFEVPAWRSRQQMYQADYATL